MEIKLKKISLTLLTILSISVKLSATLDVTANDRHCFNFDAACSQCIQEPTCQWCTHAKNVNITDHHCYSVFTDLSNDCDEIENPRNSFIEIVDDEPLTAFWKEKTEYRAEIVQLRSQKIRMKLRKGIPVNITLFYRQVKDYPLDIYYLMDLSNSMLEDKFTLEKLGKDLVKTMRSLTKQFKIGFGSFVDKVLLPFVNTHPESLRMPCREINCVTPYSFKNNLKLTENDQEFVRQVKEAQISSNIDSPEGGFDALMQAMVCDEQIGWRRNVRKIIIFSTDALSHIAGDGKLAGIITPNDGKCHLNENDYYSAYDKYDYPSIGHLNKVAQEKGVNIIFAVKNHLDFYKRLSERIKGSFFGALIDDSRNVINLVTHVYNSISGTVEIDLKSNAQSSPVSLRFFTDCGRGEPIKESNVCSNVKEGETFNFTVEIMVKDCPKSGDRKAQIEVGTLQDSLFVDLQLVCDCGCEKDTHKDYEINSPSCHGNGTKQCEVCQCHDGFYGQNCQCSKDKISSETYNDQRRCRPEGSNTDETVCSGRGRCECNTCICWNERHFGRFCECDREMCRQSINSNVECSGNGRCDCNSCLCNSGWEGRFCQCGSYQSCIPEGGGELCSGNGECICSKCECKSSYTGKYCEECPSCENGKCLEFLPCVQCNVWESGELQGEDCKNCSYKPVSTVDHLEDQLKQWAVLCTFEDEKTGCDFNFTYKYTEDAKEGYEIYAQNKQKCPGKINYLD